MSVPHEIILSKYNKHDFLTSSKINILNLKSNPFNLKLKKLLISLLNITIWYIKIHSTAVLLSLQG